MYHKLLLTLVLVLGIGLSPVAAQTYHWRLALPGPWHSIAFNPGSHGRVLFAGSSDTRGIYRTDDGGFTWTEHLDGPTGSIISDVHQVFCLPSDTNVVLAVTPTRFYRSDDGGLTWTDTLYALGGVDGESVCYHAIDDMLYYGQAFAQGVWRSSDHGVHWIETGHGDVDSIALCTLDASPDLPTVLLQGSERKHGLLARSTDEGTTWSVTLLGSERADVEVPKMIYSWYAVSPITGKRTVEIGTRWPAEDSSVIGTVDAGLTWHAFTHAPHDAWAFDIDQRRSMISQPNDPSYPWPLHFFTGLFFESDTVVYDMLHETTDGGISWHSMGFPAPGPGFPIVRQVWVLKYDTATGRIAVATDSGIYIGDTALSTVQSVGSSPTIETNVEGGMLRISSAEPMYVIRLYDILGKEITSVAKIQTDATLTTTGLAAGNYELIVEFKGGTRSHRLLHLP